MRVICIVNPRAGRGRAPSSIAEAVGSAAAGAGWDCSCVLSDAPGHATELAASVAEDADLVVAAGGDGTIHEVARGLMDTGTPIGIIPTGSGNGLARAMGIPLDLQVAARKLPDFSPRRIDVGIVNDLPFFSTAGMGLDAAVAHRFSVGKHRRGVLPYIWYGLREWFGYRPQPVEIAVGGEGLEERPLIVVVANTDQYGAGAVIAPGAKVDDGRLLVCRLTKPSIFRALLLVRRLFDGTLDRSQHYRAVAAEEAEIRRGAPGPIHVDGEPMMADARLKFSVRPGALMVWSPRPDAS